MIVVVHLSGHYEWLPVPEGTKVTEKDIAAKRVKPSASGGWVMRVPNKVDTHTTIALAEGELIGQIIASACRDKIALTRHDALAQHLRAVVMPHHAHPRWFKDFEVSNDEPDEKLFLELIGPHLACGNIDALDEADLLEAYREPSDHVPHLRGHFRVKGGA